MDTTRPTHVEVADHFYHDSVDLLARYEHCIKADLLHFSSIKSRRTKCFIDLRMAMESALKSVVCYCCHSDIRGKALVKKVENYRHHVDTLVAEAEPYLPEPIAQKVSAVCNEMKELPVGLRYRLDVMDFIDKREDLYDRTIGCDSWMRETAEIVRSVSTFIGRELSKESRILTVADLIEELDQPRYEKY